MSDKKEGRERQVITHQDIGTVEALQIVLDGPKGVHKEDQRGTPHFPCPECKKKGINSPSKPHHDPGSRICFKKDCRHIFWAKDVEAEYIASSGPRFPCKDCGKETKEHHTPPGSRICSDKKCRDKKS